MPQLEDDASATDLRKDMEEEENNILEWINGRRGGLGLGLDD